MTPADRLDEIEARANAATEGPWDSTWGDHEPARVWVSDDTGAEPIATLGGYVSASDGKPDADFIAHARQDVPALVAALRAVLSLHEPVEWERPDGSVEQECRACRNDDDEPALWPCDTVTAITAALGDAS